MKNHIACIPDQRRTVSPEQKKELALALRQSGHFTQEEVAGLVGVAQQTVSDWDGSNTETGIASIPDLRYTITQEQEEEIAKRVEAGEKQKQVAADLPTSMWG